MRSLDFYLHLAVTAVMIHPSSPATGVVSEEAFSNRRFEEDPASHVVPEMFRFQWKIICHAKS